MSTDSFTEMVQDLRKARFTDSHLAFLCGCSRQYMGKIRHGKAGKVSHDIGSRLIKLHEAIQ